MNQNHEAWKAREASGMHISLRDHATLPGTQWLDVRGPGIELVMLVRKEDTPAVLGRRLCWLGETLQLQTSHDAA